MVDRIPSGTRDFLPDEMRELRAMTERVREVFERAGYGEVYTPALEYEGTFDRANMHASRPAYRMFDEHGHVLVLRSDMTVPIARLVAAGRPNRSVAWAAVDAVDRTPRGPRGAGYSFYCGGNPR